MTTARAAAWAAIDEQRVNPRAVRLVAAFKQALTGMIENDGLTFEDLWVAADIIGRLQKDTGADLALAAMPLYSEVFQVREAGYTPSDEVASPTFVAGSPRIGNPGVLPMRPDEPGVPLVASGRVLDGDGSPLAGAEMTIYHASNDGVYSGVWADDLPEFNLRGRLLTDADGRYEYTTITPAPYTNTDFDYIRDAAAALGRTIYRPSHIHYEIAHPDLVRTFRGEVYFTGDPAIAYDFVGPEIAVADLQADTVLHDDPEELAERGFDRPFNTAAFDFVLKAKR
jgi:catechol 1,2-dioxygenase